MTTLLGYDSEPTELVAPIQDRVWYWATAQAPIQEGVATTATAWIAGGSESGRGIKIGLYDSDRNLLATADIQDTSGPEGFKSADLDSPVQLLASQTYFLAFILQTRSPPTIGSGGYLSWSRDEGESYANPLPGSLAHDSSSSLAGQARIFLSSASGPSITTADNITDETQPATITLANNENAPTAIQINGEAGSTIAFVSEDTEAGTETYSYLPPLIADDAEAELSVTVDSDTLTTTISYANSYDRDQLTHPATEAEYSTNSLSYPNAYGTSLPYEWKVITDASATVVVIDWDALEADDGFFKDIAGYATPVANGSTTVTLGVFVPETGEAYQFDRTINVSDGSVVVEGQGLWRELFRDPTEELFTELFR